MEFINSPIAIDSIPAAESLSLQPAQAEYRKVLLTEWGIMTIVLSLITAALILFIPSMRRSYGWIVLCIALLLICGIYLLSILRSFPFLAYAVRQHDVMLQKGWLVRSLRICPFNRIQNCSVQSGPLERKHGLASLIVYTAGAEGADMRIPGLSQEEADRLRSYILQRIHPQTNDNTGLE